MSALMALERETVPPVALYRVKEAVRVLGLSRTVVYDLIRTGRLRTVKEGRTRLVPASAVAEYVALLEREAGGRVA
jgi:excisionase family DNA binding protein